MGVTAIVVGPTGDADTRGVADAAAAGIGLAPAVLVLVEAGADVAVAAAGCVVAVAAAGASWTTTVPDIAGPCTWQKYVNVPAALKVWSNVPLDCGEPLSNELSVAVTVCELTPAQVQSTVSPTLMVTDAGM